MKKIRRSKGFTLVEILAVLGIIVTVGGIAGAIIFSSLRASNKANDLERIRQNGNFALSKISRTILYAKSFNGVSTDGISYSNDCTLPPGPPLPPIKYSSVKITNFDESETTYSCSPEASPTTLISTQNLEDTDLIDTNTVSVSSCYFTCSQLFKTNSPTIGMNLVLNQEGGSQFSEKQTSISFTTSVTMRNSNK
jgi:prepilin-type N-terminal cleavage/methylation domain-containing protein